MGAGLLGLSSAYWLSRSGWSVTVLDRRAAPGLETSFANGAILTPSMCEPWNAPGCWRPLLVSLFRSDSPLKLRVREMPSLLTWGIAFLTQSTPHRFERNSIRNLGLALASLHAMDDMIEAGAAARAFGSRRAGTLRVFRNESGLNCAWNAEIGQTGLTRHRLNASAATSLEPALAPIATELAGAIHYPDDRSGDAHLFCQELHRILLEQGVQFRLGVEVENIVVRDGVAVGVRTDADEITVKHVVVAAGSYSTRLLRGIGINLPVRPAKGYSITVPKPNAAGALSIPIVDDHLHAVVTPLEHSIRVAGTAEFDGFDLSLRRERISNLVALLHSVLPRLEYDEGDLRPWCGLRPMSCDGVPIIGSTPIRNLWINTGHGHLGWTMAAGSGRLLTDLMTGAEPSLDPTHYALARF